MTRAILYGAEVSYYSGKARSYLRHKRIDFEERLADISFYQEVCVPAIGYPVIPVLVLPSGQIIQDTTLIIDHFEAADGGFTPTGPRQRLVSRLMELFGDEWLTLPAMHYRWAYDAAETMLEFGMNLLPHADREKQARIGEKAAAPFAGSLPVLGIHPENTAAIEESFVALLRKLDTHFRHVPYLLGERPCAGDFGLIGPLYAHLYRDATAGGLMRKEALAVCRYVERMMMPPASHGAFLPGDAVPDTLIPVLQQQMTEQMPVLAETEAMLADWVAAHPDQKVPRGIGEHDFTLRGVTCRRMARPYQSWMYARARSIYDGADHADKASLDRLLDVIDGSLFRETPTQTGLTIENYRVALVR